MKEKYFITPSNIFFYDRETTRQTDRQTDIQTDRQTDR